MEIRKRLFAASVAATLVLGASAAHAQNPRSSAASAPAPAAHSAPAMSPTTEEAIFGSTWARVLATALRSLWDLQPFTARAMAARRDDPVAASLRTATVSQPARATSDASQVHIGALRATVVSTDALVTATSDGRPHYADLPGVAVRLPP